MKHSKIPLAALLAFVVALCLVTLNSSAHSAKTQTPSTALERGYRTGYSDGYNAGFKDTADHATRDYQSKDEYQRADRSFNEAWGTLEDYRDGYQQGYESGYAAGYDRQPFNSTIPNKLERRATSENQTSNQGNASRSDDEARNTVPNSPATSPTSPTTPNGAVMIPRDTILLIEMQSIISTDVTQRGDRFQARVINPQEYQGAIVEGRVSRVKRAGKVKGVAELQLSFDTIRLADNRAANFNADVIEILEMGSRDGVGTVDPEGGVRGRDSTKDDVSKVGAATGIGAIIGAIAGGGRGAAIGAAIGGGVGTGGVLSQRGKDIRLDRGQQLKIRTATETRLQ